MFSWFGYPIPFEERLDLIKEAGFSVTGFWLGPEEDLVVNGKADFIPDLIRSRGLFLDYVHAPDIGCNDVWSQSPSRRGAWVHTYSSYIDLCKRHSIPFLVMHVSQSKGEQPGNPTEAGFVALEKLVKVAEDSNVRIAVENTMQPDLVDLIFTRIRSDYFGLCYDTSHDYLYSPQPGELLKRWGHRLLVTHLADNDGILDRHWLPGLGILNWKEIASRWPMKTYKGSLILEVFSKDQVKESAADFMASAYRSIQWLHNLFQGEG
jgi:sugar phosphate isomerase/epimerase